MKTPDTSTHKGRQTTAEAVFVHGKFLQCQVKEKGLTQESLASELKITQGVIGQWFSGFTKIPDKRLIWLAKRLGFKPLEARRSLAEYVFDITEDSGTYHTRIPIIGNAQAGPDGYWDDHGHLEHGDGFIVASSKDPDAYALRVRGDSMAPTIKNGWLVVVEPNSPPHLGENVLVCTTDGLCMIKEYRLYNEHDQEYTFGSINDAHPAMTVQKINVTRLQPITMIVMGSQRQA
ncbi:MAG: S24 family peptidase [Candidatus Reddybacter sp.]